MIVASCGPHVKNLLTEIWNKYHHQRYGAVPNAAPKPRRTRAGCAGRAGADKPVQVVPMADSSFAHGYTSCSAQEYVSKVKRAGTTKP